METVNTGIKQRDVSFAAMENRTFAELENMNIAELQEEYFEGEKKTVEITLTEPSKEVSL